MSDDAKVTGEIRIDPPITWGEVYRERWTREGDGTYWPDAIVRFDEAETVTDDGIHTRRQGVAIVAPGWAQSARTLIDDVTRIVQQVATTPDGKARNFTGHLDVNWGHGESIYRVVVSDGQAVEVKPIVVWPNDVADRYEVQSVPTGDGAMVTMLCRRCPHVMVIVRDLNGSQTGLTLFELVESAFEHEQESHS